MALPTSPQSFPDCFDFCEKCVDDAIGARKPFKTEGEAKLFRLRCYRFRELTRQQNRSIYPPDDIRHGTSAYDELVLTISASEDGWWWVYGKRLTVGLDDVESLSQVEDKSEEENDGNEATT